MSYTSSDPENYNRDPDTSSLASTSTTASQLSKSSKKPWSKFKSSIKSIGRRMSTGSKPNFAEPTESSERKKAKKNKKVKESSGTSDVKPSSSEDKPREKSPSKGPKNLIKKLSVETISTPFVGYQPSSVSPTRSYAKAVSRSSGSTSESNLSFSDFDSPRKASTLDKSTKFRVRSQESPDSGRLSQAMDDSRPPSQVTEEGYGSGTLRAASDLSVDSGYTSTRPAAKEVPFESLVAKTAHFAQSLVPPKDAKDNNTDVSASFIKAEAVVKKPEPSVTTTKSGVKSTMETKKETDTKSSTSKVHEVNKDTVDKDSSTPSTSNDKHENTKSITNKSGADEVEGKKKDNKLNATTKKEDTSAEFIKSEQSKTPIEQTVGKDTSTKIKPEASGSTEVTEVQTKTEPSVDSTEEKLKQRTSRDKTLEDKTITEGKLDSSTDKSKSDRHSKTNDQKETKTADAIEKTLKKKNSEKNPNAEKSTSGTGSASKLPTTSVETSPLDVLEPPPSMDPKATQMTVEEKLEAFLSAEGWSGTIKDIANKSSADGSQQPDKRECLYKILVIGELGTGKTSIIKRYVHQFFSQHYRATIGVDFALKVLNWDPSTIIRLQLWDIAGQERFGNMTRVYYKEAVGAFIVFDVTRSATFDAVLKWKQDLDSKVQLADGSPIPCVLLANKCDQQKEGIVNTPAKMDEYCKENNFSAWFETSAKENINIDEAAKSLVTQILQNDKISQNGRDSGKDGKFPLDGKSEEEGKSCAC